MRYLCIVLGSPPRMRGKVMMQILEKLDERITPAYAGKSFINPTMP